MLDRVKNHTWATQHANFRQAVSSPEQPLPTGVVRFDGKVSAKRFAVYRNNVVTSLVEALRDGFPMINRLMGDNYFSALAKAYVLENVPQSPHLLEYGKRFSEFLAQFPPLSHYPYLADIATFEYHQRIALHATDHQTYMPANDGNEQWIYQPLSLATATKWLSSQYPLYQFWYKHYIDSTSNIVFAPQDVLITRQHYQVKTHLLPVGGIAFFQALAQGKSPHQACVEASQVIDNNHSHHDVTQHYGELLCLALAASASCQRK